MASQSRGVSALLFGLCLCHALTSIKADYLEERSGAIQDILDRIHELSTHHNGKKSTEEQPDDEKRLVEPETRGSREIGVEDIMGAVQKRSEGTSLSLKEVMGEVMNEYRRLEARKLGGKGDDDACNPNPCVHNEKCSTTDVIPGNKYMCYNCKADYSGLDCGMYDVCGEKHTPPGPGRTTRFGRVLVQGPCNPGELCMPTQNARGYYCL